MSGQGFTRDSIARLDQAIEREWLVTNGLGGFAAGTVALANTRRYHGLLVATLRPPVERVLLVAKLDAVAIYRGERYDLSVNEFADGTLVSQGMNSLVSFELDGQAPVWKYSCADALLELRIDMASGENTTYVSWRLLHATAPVDLELTPLCGYRDYHSHMRGGWSLGVDPSERGVRIDAFSGARPYRLSIDRGSYRSDPVWYWQFAHRVEQERGLDAIEDLFRPGVFSARLNNGESTTVTLTSEATALVESAQAPSATVRGNLQPDPTDRPDDPAWIRALRRAAGQFIVARDDAAGNRTGTTVIAGYPWFTDWGRDTMIALPGLTLTTDREDEAAAILRTFAQHVSEGMLPNRFPDGGEPPEYNTVDATLWMFHALDCYLSATHDTMLLRALLPTLADIIAWHDRGTRYGISVDHEDGLLRAGQAGVQLTWMDAKVGDWVVTPRIGKPVEINALWHFAHAAMSRWYRAVGDETAAERHSRTATKIRIAFSQRFWNADTGCLYDVVDGPEGVVDRQGRRADGRIRPNQLFAVSLGAQLLDPEAARAVVDVCARELLTPVGLRSLSPRDPEYRPRYQGGPWERDGAYHQGTVWSWLLGPFALAHYQTYGDAEHALAIVGTIAPHVGEACVGSISEIFDAEPPFAPRGCFAQAWSVSETLRAYDTLQRARASGAHQTKKKGEIAPEYPINQSSGRRMRHG